MVNPSEIIESKTFLDTLKQIFSKIQSWFNKAYPDDRVERKSDGSIVRETGENLPGGPYRVKYTPVDFEKNYTDADKETLRANFGLSEDDNLNVFVVSALTKDGVVHKLTTPAFYLDSFKDGFLNQKDLDNMFKKFEQDVVAKLKDVDETNSSKKLSIKLQKIQSSEHIEVGLIRINANYDASYVVQDVNALMDSEDLLSMFTDSDTVDLVVTPLEDELDVEVSEDLNSENWESCMLNSIVGILNHLYGMMINSQYISWNTIGECSNTLKQVSDVVIWRLRETVEDIAYISKSNLGYIPTFDSFKDTMSFLDTTSGIDLDSALAYYRSSIQELIGILNLYYCNFSHADKSILDKQIVLWSQTLSYDIIPIGR